MPLCPIEDSERYMIHGLPSVVPSSPPSIVAMVNLIAVLLVPVAVILTDTIGGGSAFSDYDEGRAAWVNFGTCFFGVILASLFGLPLILYHVGNITHVGLGLWLGSTVLTFVASVRSHGMLHILIYMTPCLLLLQIWYWITRQKGQYY